MTEIKLYRINQKISHLTNNMIRFDSDADRDYFFDSITIKKTIDSNKSTGWKKDIWKLENTITIFNIGREPYSEYNYLSIKQSGKIHYYYIKDYEELGANQIKYHLIKDVLMTYASTDTSGILLEDSNALVLREHKNRFNGSTPIYDKEIEEVSILPTEVSLKQTVAADRARLVLKQYGGGVDGQRVLSQVRYFWELFTTTTKTFTASGDVHKDLLLGWGLKITSNVKVTFFASNDSEDLGNVSVSFNNLNDKYVRLVKKDDKYVLDVRNENGTSYTVSSANRTIYGNISDNGNYFTLNEIKGNSFIIIAGTGGMMTSRFEVLYDMGMNYNDPFKVNLTNVIYNKTKNLETFKTKLLNDIDRTDIMNSKIIEIPYVPSNILGQFQSESIWGVNDNSVLISVLKKLDIDDININLFTKNYDTSKVDKLKVPLNDPKIYTSQFHPFFLTWFAESIPLKREATTLNQLTFSASLNEADYTKLKLTNKSTYTESTPYELTRAFTLNNEVSTISSDLNNYINYLYDSDVKMIQLKEEQANRSLVHSQVNQLTGIVTGAAAGAIMGGVGGASVGGAIVGGIVGAIRGGVNLGFEIAKHNNEREQRQLEYKNKIQQLQIGMINIAGSTPELNRLDDADLIKVWAISPTARNLTYLDEFFHKYGYQTLEYKKPTLKTRKYFDYKKLIYEDLKTTDVINTESINMIVNKFSEGVTVYHYVENTPHIRSGQLDDPFQGSSGIPTSIDYQYVWNNKDKLIEIKIDDIICHFNFNGNYLYINYLNEYLAFNLSNNYGNYTGNNSDLDNLWMSFKFIDESIDLNQEKENWEL